MVFVISHFFIHLQLFTMKIIATFFVVALNVFKYQIGICTKKNDSLYNYSLSSVHVSLILIVE